MSITSVSEDIGEMWKSTYFAMLDDDPGVIDFYQRNIVHSFGNHIIAEHAIFDFDLGSVGLTPTKWTKFTGQYVDVESLHAWVNNAMNVKTYDALWTFKIVPPNFTGKKAVHQWGNCLMGFSFRRQPKPPTLTLYTRAQSLGFSGIADYALCHVVAKKLAERMGIPQEKIRVQIYCANFIIKVVETVHTLEQMGLLQEYLDRDNRMAAAIGYYYNYINRPEEEIKWRAARRMKKKFHNAQAGIYRSFPVDSLDLRGWTSQTRASNSRRTLTSREASELVLTGKGRRGVGVMDFDDSNGAADDL
jgi:hypothetical protein